MLGPDLLADLDRGMQRAGGRRVAMHRDPVLGRAFADALRDLVDQLCAAGMRIGTEWVGEAIEGLENVAGVFAGMFVLAAFVIAIDGVVTLIENRLLVWRPVTAETRT